MALAVDALVTAHNAHREHPVRANQPSDGYAVRRRGRGGLVTVKEHRGDLLGVRPRPAPPGARARYRNAPLRVSRDTSRFGEGVERHVASVPLASDGRCPETPFVDAAPEGSSREGASQALSNPRGGNHGPLYGNHRPLFSRRPKARIAVVKGAAFSRACSSVIDAASRWPISHSRRASTTTTTMTTNPIRSSSTATVGPCSSSDQVSPHSYCGYR